MDCVTLEFIEKNRNTVFMLCERKEKIYSLVKKYKYCKGLVKESTGAQSAFSHM
jgi:hypothetical protein